MERPFLALCIHSFLNGTTKGDDMARSASDPTVLFGTEQGDTIWSPPGDFVIFAGSGNDSLVIGEGASLVDGGDGDDVMYCGDGTQVLMGGDGPDGDAVLHFGYGATATLLHVPAERVAAHLGDYVKSG